MINRAKLPESAAIDTGVFIRGLLGAYPEGPESPSCEDFCNAMIDARRTLFVAAPTITEVVRHAGVRVPRRRGVVVVPFDDVAAEILGLKMPSAKLSEAKTSLGVSISYLKYDAMILACAIRSRTAVMVAIDGDHTKLAVDTGFEVRHPEWYQVAPRAQRGLFD